MSHEPNIPPGEEPTWFDRPENGRLVFWGVCALYAAFILAGMFGDYERHPHFAFDKIPAWSAGFGLMCSVGLVLGAVKLREYVMRDEDYYDDE